MMRVETPDDAYAATLATVLDARGVPLHVRYGNQALAELLADDEDVSVYAISPEVVVLALRRRKMDRCPGCATGRGEHREDPDAHVQRYTPGT